MRIFLFTMLFLFAGINTASAIDDKKMTAFPPENCVNGEIMYMAWDGVHSTSCQTGQSIFTQTLGCAEGQHVVYEGGKYTCKTVVSPPACEANEVLTYDGKEYSCVHTDVPTCGPNQVLTFNGSGFICINRTDTLPTCKKNEFLTYNGTAYQCVTAQCSEPLPECGENQVLTSKGGKAVCVDQTVSINLPTCSAGQYLTTANGKAVCADLPELGKGTVYNNSDINRNVLTTPVPYKLCVLSMAGVAGCGRCVVTKNDSGTWSLDQAACNPGIPNLSYMWCAMTCYQPQ